MDFLRKVGATFFIFLLQISALGLCDLDSIGRFTFGLNAAILLGLFGLNVYLAQVVALSISRALCFKRFLIYASHSE